MFLSLSGNSSVLPLATCPFKKGKIVISKRKKRSFWIRHFQMRENMSAVADVVVCIVVVVLSPSGNKVSFWSVKELRVLSASNKNSFENSRFSQSFKKKSFKTFQKSKPRSILSYKKKFKTTLTESTRIAHWCTIDAAKKCQKFDRPTPLGRALDNWTSVYLRESGAFICSATGAFRSQCTLDCTKCNYTPAPTLVRG